MKKKVWIPLVILIVLVVAGYFVYPRVSATLSGSQPQSAYQTELAKQGSVSVAVGGTGTVRANQSSTIVWQTSGKVARVTVQKGQQVAVDELLAELEGASLPQNVLQAQVDLVNAQAALDKAINNNEARANAHLALLQAQQALEDAEQEAQSKLYRRASQETIDIARANLINANEALDQAESVWAQTQGAGEDSPVYAAGLSQYAAARQTQQQAEYNLRYVEGLPDPLLVEEANVKVDQAQAQLLTAKQNWEKVKDGPDADEVLAAQTKLDIAQATLDLARLTAPFAGTVTQLDSQVGDLVSNGLLALKLDDLSRLLVDVEISEVDIRQVQIGQPVSITFDALPGQTFGGTVVDIAAFGSATGGAVNFPITVEIQNPSTEIKPGMTAAVSVTVNQLDNVLLIPSRAVRTVDGKRLVYVLQENTPVAVEISLGASANNYSQVIEGNIQVGSLIVTNPPASGIQMGPGGGGAGGRSLLGGGQR
ncbi:MAG TPA: efflux RND transporter periplasmic adaptor subunit [Anaerolineaceae bacterium]|nr:efflux RND transporter periplasmic adaptor subunit [Anaerolineaceae bacterium]